MKALSAALLLLCCTSPASAEALTVRLLDHLVVTEQTHPQLPIREISALAWEAQGETLLAVSDRNDIYRLSLGPDRDRIQLTLTAQTRLADENAQRLRGKEFGAEGIAIADPRAGTVAILSEMPPRLSLFDRQGHRVSDLPLAPELQDISRLRSEGNGVESVALHPRLGALVAPEVPLSGQPRQTHVIYGGDGPALAYHIGDAGTTSIKGMETLPDGRLLVLERDRLDDVTIRAFLRLIDPESCAVANPCTTPAIPLELPPPLDADFEGIAWLGDNRVLLASDDRIGRQFRTVFALVEIGFKP